MIFIKEKLYAEGSLKLTRFLQREDNEPAAASFLITRLQLAGTSAAGLVLRSGNGPQEKLSTGGGWQELGMSSSWNGQGKKSLVCTWGLQPSL